MDSGGRTAAANHRLTFVAVILFLWPVFIAARLVVLQVVRHSSYAEAARRQQEERLTIPAVRGSIFDRNGQPLAISLPMSSLSVNPHQIADPGMAADVLSSFLNLDRAGLMEKLQTARQNHRGFLWIRHGLDPFETERLKSLHLAYATFHTESRREYPGGETAAHVLGGLGQNASEGDAVRGVMGIERGMDAVLRGEDGRETVLEDVHRQGIDSQVEKAATPGASLTLTIDQRMQFVAERELKAGVIAKHARSGTAIVMNPYTGEILAFANYPTYNPNEGQKEGEDPLARWNLGDQIPFEPGSMFKVITLTAALETTELRPESMIHTGNGVLNLPGRVVHESHGGLGTISMADVLAKSSNIGAILIGQQVGRQNMYEYARRFGFGQKSGLPLPAESPGVLRPLEKWGTTSLASIAMGQEVSVTSVQIARAACAIANGGLLVKPRLVLKRSDKAEQADQPVRIIKPETAILMRQMMEGVVLRGTGRVHARLNGYSSAGKTGTAQIYDPETHHYSHNYNASFVGFAPVTNPALVVLVTVHKTTGENGQGADAAAPVFSAIMTEALRMLDVPKDIPEQDVRKPIRNEKIYDDVSIADLGGTSVMEDDLNAGALAPKPAATASPVIPALTIAQTPAPPASSGVVPDFRGKSMRDALTVASAAGIELTVEGSGLARIQRPLAGAPIRQGQPVTVVFAR